MTMSDDLVKRLRSSLSILAQEEAADRIEALQAERDLAHAAAVEAAAKQCERAAYSGEYPQDDAIELGCLRSRDFIRTLHTDASLAAIDRIKREARGEALKDMLGLTINHAPERDDIHAAITALIEKEGV